MIALLCMGLTMWLPLGTVLFFLFLMKEKNQKKIKAMIAISFCLVHVVNGRCLVRLGEGKAIFAGELLLCSLYMRKKCLHFFSIVPAVCFKNMF